MGFFGPKRYRCPAGIWTTIIDDAFANMPRGYSLVFEAAGVAVGGEVEEKKSQWIVPGEPRVFPLAAAMTLERGWFNTFYRVRVKPTVQVDVTID